MRAVRLLAPLLALFLATPAAAQLLTPQSGGGDPRIQVVDYDPNQVVQIQAAQGYQVSIELAADEQIESIAVGDSGAWQVTSNRGGGHVFVKLVVPGVATNMTVVTNARQYAFELTPLYAPSPTMPYTVQFRYPAPVTVDPLTAGTVQGLYKLSGVKALRPSRISDDGERTYIEWPADAALPAVYALDDRGQEVLVNGMMRDGIFVIDSVVPRLQFRIDNQIARAVRVAQRKAES